MKRYIFRLILLSLTALIFTFTSCKKGGGGDVPDVPDKPDVPEVKELKFPKTEMRAAWITTAWGIDWSQDQYGAAAQKEQFKKYMKLLKDLNMNVAFVQIKPMGDAFYDSPYEPWCAWITGTRGKDPGYDVLKFMIDAAHAEGIEFHAWMNPYRISTRANRTTPYPSLHPSIPKSWVVDHEKIRIYNPALPEVRQRLCDIVKDLITKYDVDGVHFDDYFYPARSSAGIMVSDERDYEKYGKGFAKIEDFRRDNMTQAIKMVHETILANKPKVRFSISPAPNQKSNYDDLYADAHLWCKSGYMDFVIPQLYQEIGNKYNDFQTNMYSWAQYRGKCVMVVGHGLYKFEDPKTYPKFNSANELRNQMELTEREGRVHGNVFYSMRSLERNPLGTVDVIREKYRYPALVPYSELQAATMDKPSTPTVKLNGSKLAWNNSAGMRYSVYYFVTQNDPGRLLSITDKGIFDMNQRGYYCVVAVNDVNLQSDPSPLQKY